MSSKRTRWWRATNVLIVIALVSIVMRWQLAPAPNGARFALALLCCLPLLAPLYGLWRGNRHTYRWATLCVVPYVLIGATEVVASPQLRFLASTILFGAIAWFAALLGYLRAEAIEARSVRPPLQ